MASARKLADAIFYYVFPSKCLRKVLTLVFLYGIIYFQSKTAGNHLISELKIVLKQVLTTEKIHGIISKLSK